MKLALITLFLISTPYLLMECGETVHEHTPKNIVLNHIEMYPVDYCLTLSNDSTQIIMIGLEHKPFNGELR
jgi:hypothetical protein